MGKTNLIAYVKTIVSSIAWKLFLWGIGCTQEQYWKQIYQQEKTFKEGSNE